MDKRTTPAQLKEAWQEGWSDGYCHATVPDSGDTYSWEQSQTAKHSGTQEEAQPMSAQEAESELVERLRAKRLGRTRFGGVEAGAFHDVLVNPDGPEAADNITRLEAALREAREEACFVAKWVERALFDKAIPASDALNVIASYPGMPWQTGRWDVDHKPYAAAFYERFPKARALGAGSNDRPQLRGDCLRQS